MQGKAPVYKTILVGDGGVGKTSLTRRYTEDKFDSDMKMTIGVNFASKKVIVDDSEVNLMLWDLGGQPRFRDIVTDYFKGARIALAIYDATRFISMESLRGWIARVRATAPDCIIFFIANKIDQRVNGIGVSQEVGQAFAQEFDAALIEVSAKTGEGVAEMFESVTRTVLSS
jgi:small GTP-binding protein